MDGSGRKKKRSVKPGGAQILPDTSCDLARSYLDIAGVILIAIDRDGKVTMINRKGCELLGYPERDILGRDWFSSFIPKPMRRKVRSVFRAIMSGKMEMAERFENPVLTRKGGVRLISWRNSVIRGPDGRIISTLSSGEDVTELRRTEMSLRENEERYRFLVETSPDAVVVHDGERVLFANPAALSLVGAAKPSQLVGRDVMRFVHPDYRKMVVGRISAQRRGSKTPAIEERFLRIDGKPIDVGVSAAPIMFEGRKAMLVMIRDISEQKRHERELRLEKTKVEELSKMRERFMADIAHELKTPLSVIMLNLDMMKRMQNKPLCDISPIRGLLWRNALRISTSIDQIMQITSPGSIQVRTRAFDIARMMEDIRKDYSPLAKSKGIALSFKGGKLEAKSDPRLLSSAVSNLVSNAIKFTPRGSVAVSWRSSGRFIRISVSDTGTGIKPKSRGKVFGMFFKEDHDAPGSGIGLSLSSGFIKKLGGGITFVSRPGDGSTFTIKIPKR